MMEKTAQNRLVLAREKFQAGETDKYQYAEYLNGQHAGLFDYPAFLAGTDVADIRITADGVTVSSTAHGVAMLVDAVDLHATPYALLDFGTYEADETTFLKSVFRDGNTFVDIGANLGWYSLVLGRNCPGSKIFAFEPIPSTVEVLRKNIKVNRLENIEPIAMGMFDKEEELNFLFAPDVSGATSLKLAGQSRGHSSIQNVVCKTTTLDDFCSSRGVVPDLLKIDVEGAELMVVKGGKKTFESTPILLIELLRKWSKEFGYHPNDVFEFLASYGYKAWMFASEGRLQECPCVTDETVQTNFVFMHPEKHRDVIRTWSV